MVQARQREREGVWYLHYKGKRFVTADTTILSKYANIFKRDMHRRQLN